MTQEKIINAITVLDSDILDRYFLMKQSLAAKKRKHTWIKWASLVSCFVFIVGVIIFVPILYKDDEEKHNTSYNDSWSYDSTPGLYQMSFGFDSYQEMIREFRKNDTIKDLKKHLDEKYTYFVDRINEDKAFPEPMFNGEPITYRNEKGFSNISFLVNELFDMPWIFYYPNVSTKENFYITLTYLPESIIENQTNLIASDVIKELAPNAPNVDNVGEQHKIIYNHKLKLNDREVTALIIEYKTGKRESIFFVYDDMLVIVICDLDVWTAEWFSSLSFEAHKP